MSRSRGVLALSVLDDLEKRAGYREGGSFTHEGVEYDLDSALRVRTCLKR